MGQKHVAKHFEKEYNKPKNCMEGILETQLAPSLEPFLWDRVHSFVGENCEVRLTESSSNSELILIIPFHYHVMLNSAKNAWNVWATTYMWPPQRHIPYPIYPMTYHVISLETHTKTGAYRLGFST